MESQSTSLQTRQIVAFRLDETLYGFPIERVREILQMVEITAIPDAPSHLRGAINVRGLVVPILDVRMMLGLAHKVYALSTPIILVEGDERVAGVAVDDVSDVLTIEEERCDTAAQNYPMSEMLEAVCKLDEGMLLVLDPSRLIGNELDGFSMAESE